MLEVLYEDNHIIVVKKEAGILSQSDITGDTDLLSLVKEYVKIKYNKPGEAYIGLVHRLDRMTSGVMVFARTSKAASRLSEQIRNHEFFKSYYAVVEGEVQKNGTFEDYLYKNEKEVKSYVVDSSKGKHAKLNYRLVNTVDNLSLVDVELLTGRHHQIRVQFSSRNHPLVGDSLYGSKYEVPLMLHCYKLKFIHPTTKEEMEFVLNPTGENWDKFF